MIRTLPKILVSAAAMGFMFTLAACNSNSGDTGSVVSGVTGPSGSVPNGSISLQVYNSAGSLLYSDANASTSLQLTSGLAYNFQLSGSNVPAGTSFTLQATNIDIINGTPTSTTLVLGSNSFSPPTPGDYLFTISATGSSSALVATRTYQASVICANPNFTANSLNPSAITVTAGSGSNLYNYSASGVTASANGMAPYLCAWDLDGDGIQDTPFADCGTAVSNDYANYVGTRTIGLIVKDSCNVAQTVTNSQNLAYTVPSMPGNVFIFGQLSNPTSSAATDSRIDNVTYLATNSGGYNIVKPIYSPGANGQASFTISSSMTYGQLSSQPFGMELDIGNISDTLNISTMTGTVNVSAATLNKTVYSTDEAGDAAPVRTLSGTNCTLTNPGAQVKFLQGTPCSAGVTGDNNSVDVEVWGDYVCTVSDSGGSTLITGSFDGVANLADNCSGGGGGGGGIVPVGL